MRKGHNSLVRLVTKKTKIEIMDGHLFLFIYFSLKNGHCFKQHSDFPVEHIPLDSNIQEKNKASLDYAN